MFKVGDIVIRLPQFRGNDPRWNQPYTVRDIRMNSRADNSHTVFVGDFLSGFDMERFELYIPKVKRNLPIWF